MATKKLGRFELEGNERKNGFNLAIVNCNFARYTALRTALDGEYAAGSVLVRPDALDQKLSKPLTAIVSVTNMYQTFRVILKSPIGTVQIAHDPEIETMERLMNYQHVSIVTSDIEVFIDQPSERSIRQLFDEVEQTTRGILAISRLAQTCWHDWCSIAIYQKENENSSTLQSLKLRQPRPRAPRTLGLTNPAHSQTFFQRAYRGYSAQLEPQHGFDTALEWYIESNATDVIESKYLLACTCLELLADRLAKDSKSEFILPEKKFKGLSAAVSAAVLSWFSSETTLEKERDLILTSLSGLNRRSFRTRITTLLKRWSINTDDLDLDLQQIISNRNEIVHTGKCRSGNIVEHYLKLYVAITRVFLAILGYDTDYYDWFHGGWRNQDWLLSPSSLR